MHRVRVIPVLSIHAERLVKTVRFGAETYIGDPINSVKIFNEKEVDEIAVIDITAAEEKRGPNFRLISEMAGECFMPMCYGGGVTSLDDMKRLFSVGIEKISVQNALFENPEMIREAADRFGTQAIVASIDIRKNWFGRRRVVRHRGRKAEAIAPVEWAQHVAGLGVGEILLNSVDQDGTFKGYDLDLIAQISKSVEIPVVALGGASRVEDLSAAVRAGASAVAAGSFFVFQGKHRAVLISFPGPAELEEKVYTQA